MMRINSCACVFVYAVSIHSQVNHLLTKGDLNGVKAKRASLALLTAIHRTTAVSYKVFTFTVGANLAPRGISCSAFCTW